jgi:FAD/FMN-containing dehydrogenase
MDFIGRLRQLLGPEAVLTAPAELAPYLVDHRRLYHGATPAVLAPANTGEVARLLALCNEARVAVVPQGGNTGYCGGATPDESGTQLVLSMHRLNRIREVDAANFSLTVEAGCVLAQVQAAAQQADRLFALSLG